MALSLKMRTSSSKPNPVKTRRVSSFWKSRSKSPMASSRRPASWQAQARERTTESSSGEDARRSRYRTIASSNRPSWYSRSAASRPLWFLSSGVMVMKEKAAGEAETIRLPEPRVVDRYPFSRRRNRCCSCRRRERSWTTA